MTPIPFYSCWDAGMKSAWGEVLREIKRVLGSGRYLAGERVAALESFLAQRHRVAHAVAVSSGTDALALTLRAIGDYRLDAAWTPALGCPATVAAIQMAGLCERFVDVSGTTGLAEAPAFAARLEWDRTPPRALVPVHLWGRRVEVAALAGWRDDALARYRTRCYIVEDASQGYGLPGLAVNSDAAVLSFYPTKPLGGIGDGGAVLTNDAALAAEVRSLRDYGRPPDGTWNIQRFGWNARLSEVEAAALLVLAHRAERAAAQRAAIAAQYRHRLPPSFGWLPADGTPTTNHLFPIRVRSGARDTIRAALGARGIGTGAHYTPALPDIPACADPANPYPVARGWAAAEISLPIYAGLRPSDVDRVADAVLAATAEAEAKGA